MPRPLNPTSLQSIDNMAEPTTTSSAGLLGLFVVLFGPVFGEWALILYAALAGGMWTVSRIETQTHKQAAWLLIKLVLTAFVFTSLAASVIETHWNIPAKQILAPAAFLIAFVGEKWQGIAQLIYDKVSNALSKAFGE